MSQTARKSRAFTLVETLAIGAFLAGSVSAVVVSKQPARERQMKLRDATQIRGMLQSVTLWAQNDRDLYPIPSRIDRNDSTVADVPARTKDTTGNIYSILVYNGLLPTGMLISPLETNDQIQDHIEYQLDEPEGAANPEQALWDPGFRSSPRQELRDFDTEQVGHTSYAHPPIFGPRRAKWAGTFSSRDVAIANRGPAYEGGPGEWELVDGELGTGSNTLGFYGAADNWEGHVGYNDNTVRFHGLPYRIDMKVGETEHVDHFFVNENDLKGTQSTYMLQSNVYFRITDAVTGVEKRRNRADRPTVSADDLFVD